MTCVSSATVTLTDLLDLVEIALAPLARRLPPTVAREDLASAGKLALVAAHRRCDGSADEVRAYCFVRVRGAMLDELRRLDPLSRQQRDRCNAITRIQAQLSHQLGRTPSIEEVASTAGLKANEVSAALNAAAQSGDPGEVEWSTIPDNTGASTVELVEYEDLRAGLDLALSRLPAKQALALRKYYLEEATLDEIAAELGVSRERARQVREAGEKKLREDLIVLSLWQAFADPSRE